MEMGRLIGEGFAGVIVGSRNNCLQHMKIHGCMWITWDSKHW